MGGMPGMSGMRSRPQKADIVVHKVPCSLEDLYRGKPSFRFLPEFKYFAVVDDSFRCVLDLKGGKGPSGHAPFQILAGLVT